MKKLIFGSISIFLTLIMSIGLTVFGITEGWTQQKKQILFKAAAENSKYTKQYSIDVSANHQIRIFKLTVHFPRTLR